MVCLGVLLQSSKHGRICLRHGSKGDVGTALGKHQNHPKSDGVNPNILHVLSVGNKYAQATQQIAFPYGMPWISCKREPPSDIYIYIHNYICSHVNCTWFHTLNVMICICIYIYTHTYYLNYICIKMIGPLKQRTPHKLDGSRRCLQRCLDMSSVCATSWTVLALLFTWEFPRFWG